MDGKLQEKRPSAAKADPQSAAVTARLKPCPFKTACRMEFFAACKARIFVGFVGTTEEAAEKLQTFAEAVT